MNRIGIIVEGESDKEILEIIIFEKLNKNKDNFRFLVAGGKTKLLKNLRQHINYLTRMQHCNKIIILPDCDNFDEQSKKIVKITGEIKKRMKDVSIELCFLTQKIESWLLGCYEESLKEAKNEEPDNIKGPISLIEKYEGKRRNGENFRYNKISDGKRIANSNELKHFEHSASFRRFEKILEEFN